MRLSQEALALGAPGVLALPPFYYKGVSDDGLFRFFAELIERVGDDRLRLFLYHIPPMAQVGFTPELIGRLLDAYPAMIAGTKDSAGDAERIERDLPRVPAADRVRRLRGASCSTRCAGAATAASRPPSTSPPRQTREVYDLLRGRRCDGRRRRAGAR